jgi:hypothetical protein
MPGNLQETRRAFVTALSGLAAAGCGKRPAPRPRRFTRPPVVILRSGWQWENIGDIAHTPGVLRLLRQYLREGEIILWSNGLNDAAREMLRRNFPDVAILSGETGAGGWPQDALLRAAFERSDFLLHGSGPSVVARRHLEAWRQATGKPYGIFGVTIALGDEAASPAMDEGLRRLLEGAAFVFTRETRSLENLKQARLRGPRMEFVPDGSFSLRLHDEERAKAYMKREGLEPKQFIAVVPRLRYTPYHKFRPANRSPEEIRRRDEVNEKHAGTDHAKLREVIVRWVRETGGKALLCPEMTYQTGIIDPLLWDRLPGDVKGKVVRRKDYWLTDEASSVYRRAVAVVSFECHSPIIAATNDTPAIYVHQPEDGIKGQMWRDVGLAGQYMEVEESSGSQIADRLMQIHTLYAAAQVEVHEATVYARRLHSRGMDALRDTLLGAG